MENKSTHIAIVEDEILFRKSLNFMLSLEENFEVIFEANNGIEILEYLESTEVLPDIILMDIKMPELNGIETTKLIVEKFPSIKVVILTTYNSETFVVNILHMGAAAYISKNSSPDEMIANLNLVVENGFYYKDFMLKYIYNDIKPEKTFFDTVFLTSREIEILKLICLQKSATEIAEELFISSRTVDGHRNSLLDKTNSKSIVGLVLYAMQHNLYIPEMGN